MRFQNPFSALAPTGLDSQVLTVLSRSQESLTAPSVHRLLPERGSPRGVADSLKRLTAQGTVAETLVGNTTAYRLNRDHVLATAIIGIANARGDFLGRIEKRILDQWPCRPTFAALFGSAARGDMLASSDIDLLVVIPDDCVETDVDLSLAELERDMFTWTGNVANLLVYREHEVIDAPIFRSVLEDGIPIVGESSWLRRAVKTSEAKL